MRKVMLIQRLALAALLLPLCSLAQLTTPPDTSNRPNDGFYERLAPSEREVIAYDHIRESDVHWQRRVWRVIEVNEKMNLPFQYSNIDWQDLKPMSQILLDAAQSGEISAYDEDFFKTRIKFDEVTSRGGAGWDTVPTYDAQGEIIGDTAIFNEFNRDMITKFRIKEDWFIDKETGTMQCRIIGIAPVIQEPTSGMDMALFWAYYPELRKVLVKEDVFNPKNDAVRYSWDDLMEARMFSSYVIKESNVFDRRISEYASGIDALMESERVRNEIFEKEHDMWSY
ncbi:MAG TPA: gliding motility protein GldN [Chitinophagales bacterium]|nr:gliding motility protein GldN [Chitinophagales bacterium]